MKKVALGAVLFIAVFAAPVFDLGPIQGVRPNPAIALMVVIALTMTPAGGAAVGFATGLLEGAVAGRSPGAFLVSRTVAGFAAGCLRLVVLGESVWMSALATFGATIGTEFVFYIMSPKAAIGSWGGRMLIEALINAALAVPAYAAARWALRKPTLVFPSER
jgi:hypothetical protein